MSYWDDDHDYENINGCLEIFEKWATRGRIRGQIEDKYGSTRWYAYFGYLTIHDIFYPRHYYNQFKWKWLWVLSCHSNPFFKYTGIEWLYIKWQIFCYRSAYAECFKKFPQFKNHAIDYSELLKGIKE